MYTVRQVGVATVCLGGKQNAYLSLGWLTGAVQPVSLRGPVVGVAKIQFLMAHHQLCGLGQMFGRANSLLAIILVVAKCVYPF